MTDIVGVPTSQLDGIGVKRALGNQIIAGENGIDRKIERLRLEQNLQGLATGEGASAFNLLSSRATLGKYEAVDANVHRLDFDA